MQTKALSRRQLLLGHPDPASEPDASTSLPHTAMVTEACLSRRGVACRSCDESCPENAIRFRPRIGGPFLPEIDETLCTGCDACLAICPVGAIATRINGLEGRNA
ncbi:4Fe-4S ferredoxin iron-sulfur binding domain protein [Rhizobium leguminosarum bv. trifolii WSM2304]|uniref:4Fe-4S ferredoxin iron-sulfur binding domain protein n=1 Tax=Rhizobium leguminosarum bv. trifolii (strain WSM2304) TaxID=395492 RepID=A0ABF7QPL3_RHILW|nr:4Fe-4S dicluster domain-containing protein [Rhizobium leguminosarum]ACI56208.1 4Fe-4S ferredoxin iron-sulfur binding domain protein [Rhizobium leguminosarum bv. trifolii WSM2304]